MFQKVNDSTADFFWEDTLDPIPDHLLESLMDHEDDLDRYLEHGSILRREDALALAQSIDIDGPFGPDLHR